MQMFPLLLTTTAAALSLCATPRPTAAAEAEPGQLLQDLMRPAEYSAARVSSHDPAGSNLDFLASIAPGETRVLADIEGPGMITHIWITTNAEKYYGRKIVLRMYWEGQENPSVLTPLGDFFCMGHAVDAEVRSLPITATSGGRSKNSFFKMPFNRRARIEITNEGTQPIGSFYYYVNYRRYDSPFEKPLYFHAHYRQAYPPPKGKDYLVASLEGQGNYVGTVLSYESHSDGWWGEGDDKFFIDGETTPSLYGTGTEDYLNDAWGIWLGSSPFYGTTIHEAGGLNYPAESRYTSYRWHIADPIPFRKSLRFEIEHYGAGLVNGSWDGFVERFDDLSSVAYWYQTLPHKTLEPLPPVEERMPGEVGKTDRQVLRFKRLAREPQTSETLAELRSMYQQLAGTREAALRELGLALDFATALAAGGQTEEAARLLSAEDLPFIPEAALKRPELKPLLEERTVPHVPLLVQVDDGSMRRVQRDEKTGFSTDVAAGGNYLYFRLPENSPLRGKTEDALLRVSYYSEGEADEDFGVEYTRAGAGEGRDVPYQNAQEVTKASERGWHTAEISLPQAKFSGAQNRGADFRIHTGSSKKDVVVRSVEIAR